MKKIPHLFIYIAVLCIVVIVFFQVYQVFLASNIQKYTIFTLIEGQGFIDEKKVQIQEKNIIKVGNILTTKEKSLGIIEWGDGSITRLASNTKVEIKEESFGEEISKTRIAFSLLEGKTWSKVISMLDGQGYFKEFIDDVEAGVKGTTFEANADQNYISVHDHVVTLTKGEKTLEVTEGKPVLLDIFTFIDIKVFLEKFQDTNWEQINTAFDEELFSYLKNKALQDISHNTILQKVGAIFLPRYAFLQEVYVQKDISLLDEKITTLSLEDKKFLYKTIEKDYQKINFVTPAENELFTKKIYLRNILLRLAVDSDQKEVLVKNTVFDTQDILSLQKYEYLKEILPSLNTEKETLSSLGISITSLFQTGAVIPQDVQELFFKYTPSLDNIFSPTLFQNFDLKKTKTSITNLNEKAQEKLQESLDSVVDIFQK